MEFLVEKELIINSTPTEVEIALLEDGKLVELHNQKTNTNFTVGDIFLGKIFVRVGWWLDCEGM